MSHKLESGSEPLPQQNGDECAPRNKQGFVIGALSGAAFAVLAPFFTKKLRPVVRSAIKGGIVTGRYVQKVAEGVVEDLQDITAEARAEIAKDESSKA
jgi:hypothetical protein